MPDSTDRRSEAFRNRRLSLVLGGAGIAAAAVIARGLAAMLPPAPAAVALLPGAAVLAAMILAQTGTRFATAIFDPVAGADSPVLRVNQRVLTNTVEQLAVFAPALLALEASGRHGAVLPALGLTFAIARLVFWGGYLLHPMARAPGMAATLTVTLSTLLSALWFALG